MTDSHEPEGRRHLAASHDNPGKAIIQSTTSTTSAGPFTSASRISVLRFLAKERLVTPRRPILFPWNNHLSKAL